MDKDGDSVTLTCRTDVQSYLAELVAQYQKAAAAGGSHGPKLSSNQLPPMKVQLCRVATQVRAERGTGGLP